MSNLPDNVTERDIERAFGDETILCDQCDEAIDSDEINQIKVGSFELTRSVCNDCLEKDFVQCQECEKFEFRDDSENGVVCFDCSRKAGNREILWERLQSLHYVNSEAYTRIARRVMAFSFGFLKDHEEDSQWFYDKIIECINDETDS